KTLEEWNARFSEKRLGDADLPIVVPGNQDIASVVVSAYADAFALTKSRGDARRLIEQGSVQLDGEKIRDPKAILSLRPGQVLRLDKTHAVRIG
ncbi:MAG: tyrosine--tRNA ligase, partial [Verrucomicrobia bacterium]